MAVSDLVKQAQAQAKRTQLADYKAEQQRRYDLYHGEYRRYLTSMLRQRNPNTWQEFTPVYIDLYRMVVDRLAGALYRPAPMRTYLVNGETVEDENTLQRLNVLCRGLDNVLDKVARYGVSHRTVVVLCVWRHNRVELDVLPPMQFDVAQGYPDPTALDDADALIVHHTARTDTPGAVDEIVDTVWTWHPDAPGAVDGMPHWYTLDADGQPLDSGPNEYRVPTATGFRSICPAAVFHAEDPDDTFFLAGGNDLTDAALHVAYELTDIARTGAFQSHGQPVFTGMSPTEAGKMILSPSRGMALSEAQDFKYVSPAGDGVATRLESLKQYLAQLAHSRGLPADTFDDHRRPESGIARRIANEPLAESREMLASRLAEFEADLLQRMIAVHNAHAAPADALPFDLYVELKHSVKTSKLDPAEQLELDERRIRLGVLSPVDVIMRDRGVTRDEAETIFAENTTANTVIGTAGLRAAVQARLPGGNPTDNLRPRG